MLIVKKKLTNLTFNILLIGKISPKWRREGFKMERIKIFNKIILLIMLILKEEINLNLFPNRGKDKQRMMDGGSLPKKMINLRTIIKIKILRGIIRIFSIKTV